MKASSVGEGLAVGLTDRALKSAIIVSLEDEVRGGGR